MDSETKPKPVYVADLDAPVGELRVFDVTLAEDDEEIQIYAPTMWDALAFTYDYGIGRIKVFAEA